MDRNDKTAAIAELNPEHKIQFAYDRHRREIALRKQGRHSCRPCLLPWIPFPCAAQANEQSPCRRWGHLYMSQS
jgi:hypothetical protein